MRHPDLVAAAELAMTKARWVQLRAFQKKFGRPCTPADPLWFDPDKDEPMKLGDEPMVARMAEVFRLCQVPEELIAAFEQTGVIPMKDLLDHHWTPQQIEEWADAVDEWRSLNEPKDPHRKCECGSGKAWKRCHGRPADDRGLET